MILPEGIAIGAFVLSTVGFMYKMTKDVAEIRKQVTNDIQHISEEEGKKRARVYERLDEYKKDVDKKFVLREVCHTVHEQTTKKIDEMATDIKTLVNRK